MVQPLSQQRFQDPALVSRTTGVTPAIGMQGVAPRPPQPGGSFSSDPCLSHPCRSPAACCKAGLELSSDDSFQMKLPPVVKYEIKKREMWFVLQPGIIRALWLCPVHVVTYTGMAKPPAPSSTRCSKSPFQVSTLTPPKGKPQSPPKADEFRRSGSPSLCLHAKGGRTVLPGKQLLLEVPLLLCSAWGYEPSVSSRKKKYK